MATFGLRMYKANDPTTIIYDSSSVTWNQVDQIYVSGGGAATRTYDGTTNKPDLRGKDLLVVQMLIDQPPITRRAIAHTVTTNTATGSVTISGGSENANFWVLMR